MYNSGNQQRLALDDTPILYMILGKLQQFSLEGNKHTQLRQAGFRGETNAKSWDKKVLQKIPRKTPWNKKIQWSEIL